MDGENCHLRAKFAQCYNIKTLQNLLYYILSLSAGTQVGHHLEQSESSPSRRGGRSSPPMQVCFLTEYLSGQCINLKNSCFKEMEFSDIVEGEEGAEII